MPVELFWIFSFVLDGDAGVDEMTGPVWNTRAALRCRATWPSRWCCPRGACRWPTPVRPRYCRKMSCDRLNRSSTAGGVPERPTRHTRRRQWVSRARARSARLPSPTRLDAPQIGGGVPGLLGARPVPAPAASLPRSPPATRDGRGRLPSACASREASFAPPLGARAPPCERRRHAAFERLESSARRTTTRFDPLVRSPALRRRGR